MLLEFWKLTELICGYMSIMIEMYAAMKNVGLNMKVGLESLHTLTEHIMMRF